MILRQDRRKLRPFVQAANFVEVEHSTFGSLHLIDVSELLDGTDCLCLYWKRTAAPAARFLYGVWGEGRRPLLESVVLFGEGSDLAFVLIDELGDLQGEDFDELFDVLFVLKEPLFCGVGFVDVLDFFQNFGDGFESLHIKIIDSIIDISSSLKG